MIDALHVGAVVVVGTLTAAVGALWLGQRRLIYVPDTVPVPSADAVLPGARDVVLTTADGLSLGAWIVSPQRKVDRNLAVLVAHGNGGNRLGLAPLAAALAAHGLTVMLMDYRGYGGNRGSPSEAGLALDVRAARAHLVEEGWTGDQIIYVGESLGSAVVTELATEHPPAGLVLRSPFTDLAAAGRHHYPMLPVRLMLWDRLPVAELVERVHVPTVVVYGTADSVIPFEQSRQVADRAPQLIEMVVVEGADHNDPTLALGAPFIDAVVSLADRLDGQREPG
jgi:pimeloyl-ACP methyl ester carboxylesterase